MSKGHKDKHGKFHPHDNSRKISGCHFSREHNGIKKPRFLKRKDLPQKDDSRINRKDFDDVIPMNKDICKFRPELYGYKKDFLDMVYDNIEKHSNEENNRDKIVNIATEIIAGFVYQQPFYNANKTTGTVTMIDYLEKNGYRINDDVIDQIADLGEKWNICYEDDKEKLYEDFRNLLKKNIEPKV